MVGVCMCVFVYISELQDIHGDKIVLQVEEIFAQHYFGFMQKSLSSLLRILALF